MLKKFTLIFTCMFLMFCWGSGDLKQIKFDRKISPLGKQCIECHSEKTPGIVNDWRNSRHAHVSVSCEDCHKVSADNPMAQKKPHTKDGKFHVSVLVSPKTCAKCHEQEVKEFQESGHGRAGVQMFANPGMVKLMYHFEGRDHETLKYSSQATGCSQCHGAVIKMDENGKPTKETWPNYGIGNAYPDGGVGNCKSCHSSHTFNIAEARKPAACASCHLGPDHPDIEIYNNSMHGHIFNSEGHKWNYDAAPDTWSVVDFRAPTCATCHMSGIGETNTTHNISRRLKWNAWAPVSSLRNGGKDMAAMIFDTNRTLTTGNPTAGHPDGAEAGRKEMKMICKNCHSSTSTNNFFEMADQHVELYNVYIKDAQKLLKDLKDKKLLGSDPWADEFQIVYYYMWHHEGRRMRQGALMNGPDYSHWHGVFEVQQDLRKLKAIHKKRIESGKIE